MSNLLSDIFQQNKIEDNEAWRKEWEGMPEFEQKDLGAEYSVIVSFKTFEDLVAFSKLVDQKITIRTQSIWYPKQELDIVKDIRYSDSI